MVSLLNVMTMLAQTGTDFITDLWDGLQTTISQVIAFMVNLFNSIVAIFWTSGTNGGLTIVGYLLLTSIGIGLFWLAFRLIRNLVGRLRG